MDWSKFFRSHGNFIIAQLQGAEDLYEVAVNVLCIYRGRVLTVDDIMLECPQYNPIKQQFEAWVFETKNRVLAIAEELDGVPKDALCYVLEEDIHDQEVNYNNALGAINKLKSLVESNMKDQI